MDPAKFEKFSHYNNYMREPLDYARFSKLEMDGIKFNSGVQYFNYHKAKQFGFEDLAQRILKAKTPMDAFRLGKNIAIPAQIPEDQKVLINDRLKMVEKELYQKVCFIFFHTLYLFEIIV
jgi:predicted NAD-dependent protein-ADP-ribosyltransferase YbiA (DUF1768 family)